MTLGHHVQAERRRPPVGILSHKIGRIPFIEVLVGQKLVRSRFGRFWEPVSAIAGWGHKPTARTAIRYARAHQLPYIALEDGFLRSVGLGKDTPPQAVIVDDIGVYYDASGPSRLEHLAQRALTLEELNRTRGLIQHWRRARVSKYNHLREFAGTLPAQYVLVTDQTLGDASVALGQANATSFARMLQAALNDHPACTVVIKVHPEVMAGTKQGYFDLPALARNPQILVLGEDVHPVRLIEMARAVYTVTSQIGFEALLWGKPVHTYGMPFYAGWGLTQDALNRPNRRRDITIEQLTHAALVEYPRYIHPETHRLCQVEDLVDWVEHQRRMRKRFAEKIYALNFSWNKRPSVRKFLSGSDVTFVRDLKHVPTGATAAVWGSTAVARSDLQVVRLEDGFLRSVGLGADLVRPASWVVDTTGIYYDATRPSDLETILQTADPAQATLERAQALRRRIVEAGISKYNLGGSPWSRPSRTSEGATVIPTTQRVLLVPGQVETDASIKHGAPVINKNIDLLKAVRAANPYAYIVYKPHPDVVAGLRAQGPDENYAAHYCDEIITGSSIHHLLNAVDEVHVMTSLTGFEALLRQRTVVTYGHPFYAGWGLTQDHFPLARRTRQLTLDQLVAGVLIAYPTYVRKEIHGFCSPETVLTGLVQDQTRAVAFKGLKATLRRAFARATSTRR